MRAGSEDAAREFVRRYERPVFNLLIRMLRDRARAEDVARETFSRAFRRLDTLDTGRRFASWLFRIAHHAAIDALRRQPPLADPVDDDAEGPPAFEASTVSPEAAAAQAWLGRAIDRALGAQRPEYRAAIVLRYQEDLSYEEIAMVLDVPVATARTHVHRGRKALAERLAALGWGGPRHLTRWLDAERADRIDEAEDACRAALGSTEKIGPGSGFADVVMRASPVRSMRSGRIRPRAVAAVIAVVVVAGVGAGLVVILPVMARQAVGAVAWSAQALIWLLLAMEEGWDIGTVFVRSAQAVRAAMTTREATVVLVALQAIAVVALFALHRLLASEKESL